MGTEYHVSMAFGYVIDRDAIDKQFVQTTPDKTESQPRWDPKTGQPAEPDIVVVEYGGDNLVLDGEEYGEDWYEFLDDLAKKVGADEASCANDPDGDATDVCVGIRPKRVPHTGTDGMQLSVGPDYYLNDLIAKADRLPDIKKKLQKLGLKVGAPRVVQIWSIS